MQPTPVNTHTEYYHNSPLQYTRFTFDTKTARSANIFLCIIQAIPHQILVRQIHEQQKTETYTSTPEHPSALNNLLH